MRRRPRLTVRGLMIAVAVVAANLAAIGWWIKAWPEPFLLINDASQVFVRFHDGSGIGFARRPLLGEALNYRPYLPSHAPASILLRVWWPLAVPAASLAGLGFALAGMARRRGREQDGPRPVRRHPEPPPRRWVEDAGRGN